MYIYILYKSLSGIEIIALTLVVDMTLILPCADLLPVHAKLMLLDKNLCKITKMELIGPKFLCLLILETVFITSFFTFSLISSGWIRMLMMMMDQKVRKLLRMTATSSIEDAYIILYENVNVTHCNSWPLSFPALQYVVRPLFRTCNVFCVH